MYRKAATQKHSLFYSKLAVLELCGWIEESMDDVILRCASRHLAEDSNRKKIREDVVKRTYGFEYENHFRKMLIQLVGLIEVERIESSVDQVKKDQLKATLGALKASRDGEAHTHLKGVTRTINAPSVTLNQFELVADGLLEYDRVIRSMKF